MARHAPVESGTRHATDLLMRLGALAAASDGA
jgi:hypothetical protein